MRSMTTGVIRVRGLSLIECLIALVVLSIGLLGMARLVIEGLRTGHLALLQTQATNLVSDMAERIRANPAGGDAYECASYSGSPSGHGCAPTDSAASANCTTSELAEDDLARWQGAARMVLPLADDACAANVEFTAPSAPHEPSQFRVSVSWMSRGDALPATYRSDLLLVTPP